MGRRKTDYTKSPFVELIDWARSEDKEGEYPYNTKGFRSAYLLKNKKFPEALRQLKMAFSMIPY